MAEDVQVHVTDATVISCLNTPGGLVSNWRNDVERDLLARVFRDSPVNDILNTLHDQGERPPIGDYQRSWVTRRFGNQHRVGFQIENFSGHAVYVEEGRRGSIRQQTFSWTEWGGDIRTVGGSQPGGTKGRPGTHLLRDATNVELTTATGGAYTPLV